MQCVDLRCAELHQLTPHFVQRQYRLLLLSFHSDGFSRLLNRHPDSTGIHDIVFVAHHCQRQ